MISKTVFDKTLGRFVSSRFIKYCVVGASGVVVNLCAFWLFRKVGVHINLSSALAIELSIISNFLLNNSWTFLDRRSAGSGIAGQVYRFHLTCLTGAAIQFVVFAVMNMVWVNFLPGLANAAAFTPTENAVTHWIWRPLFSPADVGEWALVSQLMGIALATFCNYTVNCKWTWAENRGKATCLQETAAARGR